MKDYTVVLLRPEYYCKETPYGKNIYVALISLDADTPEGHYDAIKIAQKEVFDADTAGAEEFFGVQPPENPEDYKLGVVFEGKHKPALSGWQAH